MYVLNGKGVSAGVAAGPILVKPAAREQGSVTLVKSLNPEAELARFHKARTKVLAQLEALQEKTKREIGEDEAAIFEMHAIMVQDPDLGGMIEDYIQQHELTAEAAVQTACSQFAAMLESMDDEYMKARGTDVRDISAQLIEALSDRSGGWISRITRPVILCADDLTPSETVQLDKRMLLGFITSSGSANSHTAILARTMGIPAVVNTGQLIPEALDGHMAAIDGANGRAFLDPDPEILAAIRNKLAAVRARTSEMAALRGVPTVTKSGRHIDLFANVGQVSDMPLVEENDGEGVGLFRSEFLYLGRSDYPSEEVLLSAYRQAASALKGKKLVIRTLDIGADKQADYFQLPREENPAMGLRAIRICLQRPEIFYTQLRAILRASAYGKVAVMFPMITSVEEVRESRKILKAAMTQLVQEGIPFDRDLEVGIMIETPAAAVISDDLAQEVDFFSIGTNDLVQYTLAADRQNAALEALASPSHPAVLRLIQRTIRAGHDAGIWVGICGEAAADPKLIPLFVEMGVDELSMSPSRILGARKLIRSLP
jgi:phosphotransferase system enzyme I (PtsI)